MTTFAATTLAAARDVAHPRVLVAALAHRYGDLALLDRARHALQPTDRPHAPAPLADAVRDEITALLQHAAEERGELTALPDHDLRRLAAFCAGEPVPDDYLPLIREDAGLDGTDARRPSWSTPAPPAEAGRFRVAVVGAGLGGVGAGIRLKQAGFDFEIFEKNAAIGGTWFENDYPDLRVDVPSHFYSYSFAPNATWSDNYSRRDEIDAYIEDCADRFDIRSHVRLDTEVLAARYDRTTSTWLVTITDGTGPPRQVRFDAVISAVGMLNRPHVPAIDGLDSFRGPAFHSSRWDHRSDLRGRRVGVVGTGASAVQLGPAIAELADRLFIFQRARHWVLPNPKYLAPISDAERWLFDRLPHYGAWYRFLLFWLNGDRQFPAFRVDPAWEDQSRSISEANDKVRVRATRHIRDELGGDEALLSRVLPDYPPFGKRILQDGGWYRCLARDDVTLVDDTIERVEPDGIRLTSGEKVELDALVLATGFHANKFLWPIEITGRDDQRLHDLWGDDPRAHLGITVPGFPNLFCIYGPNTNPVVGSVIFMLECQIDYIVRCLRSLIEGGWASMECRQDAHDDYNRRVDAEHDAMVWRHPRVRSYYNNASGRVTTNVPWSLLEYWRLTHAPDLRDFHLVDASASTGPGEG